MYSKEKGPDEAMKNEKWKMQNDQCRNQNGIRKEMQKSRMEMQVRSRATIL
jgi:hypothetical protein